MGLAPVLVDLIFDTIEKIREQGTTVLLVEQNALAALRVADYAYVLESGRLKLEGPARRARRGRGHRQRLPRRLTAPLAAPPVPVRARNGGFDRNSRHFEQRRGNVGATWLGICWVPCRSRVSGV